jgi:CRISPR-associated endonuclease Csn1
MKKILGLDLGSASIGWALIEESNNKTAIIGLGSRIIPYEGTEGKDFAKGKGESRNSIRTKARTARKGYDRYQLRRKFLVDALVKAEMFPDETLKNLPKIELWALRDKAVHSQVTLKELGRLLLWLNQKRGYKSSRSDANLGKKDTEYVATVKSRHEKIKELDLTIGQYFYKELANNSFYKVKENIFPREAYIEEFDAICNNQKLFYPKMLTEAFVLKLRNEIIYYQRPLKSQKGLVSVCEFEGFRRLGKDGKEYFVGPKVAPKSSPIFQLSKMWENINNIKVGSRTGGDIEITPEQKQAIFEHLDNNEKLTVTDLLKILRLDRKNCYVNKQIEKGLIGNITKHAIRQCFGDSTQYNQYLNLNIEIVENDTKGYLIDKKTGELLNEKSIQHIDSNIEKEPLYQLWHTIYSIQDKQECSNALQKRFSIESSIADRLANIDFSKHAFGNKSAKAIRKILPYLMQGDKYSEAMSYAGYEHSDSLTKDENLKRKLLDALKPIQKNSLRQPIVEKILNQMVNVVNAIIEKYGKPDEIRVELARELKQSKEERNDIALLNSANEIINKEIAKRLTELGLPSKKKNIEKFKYIFPIRSVINKEGKVESPKLKNAFIVNQCVYCGEFFSLTDAISGDICDVDHIIPRKLLFDDSQTNKVLVHRKCNQNDKSDKTAYDFIRAKGNYELERYLLRIDDWYNKGILSRGKRMRLLASHEDYTERKKKNQVTEFDKKLWEDFINRQINETRYISTKAKEILQTICHNVWATSGTITAELRHLWGWDEITMNLQFEKYKQLGLTKMVEWESDHGKNKHQKEVITSWTKRDDHRHHAIDALTIACTKQGYIQRFNTLSAEKTREDMYAVVEERSVSFNEKRSLLEKYIISEKPISVAEVEKAVANILISFKSGKKVAVFGNRKIGKRGSKKVVQKGIIVPRGSLHEEGVYGSIKRYRINSKTENIDFENQIVKKYKLGVGAQGFLFNGKETYEKKEKVNKKTGEISIEIKDKIQNVLVSIVDNGIRKAILQRLNQGFPNGIDYKSNPRKALENLKDLENNPIYLANNIQSPIKTVRCFTGLSAVVPVKKDETGKDVGFVKPGNNHHIAIYKDEDGNRIEHVCTFWHAVERKKYGIPIIIKDTSEVWDKIHMQSEGAYPDSFLEKLPNPQLILELSMQQNEMFVLGMTSENIQVAIDSYDYKVISEKLYRIQKLSESYYMFRHHLETQLIDDNYAKASNRFILTQSFKAFFSLNPYKLKIDRLGNIAFQK